MVRPDDVRTWRTEVGGRVSLIEVRPPSINESNFHEESSCIDTWPARTESGESTLRRCTKEAERVRKQPRPSVTLGSHASAVAFPRLWTSPRRVLFLPPPRSPTPTPSSRRRFILYTRRTPLNREESAVFCYQRVELCFVIAAPRRPRLGPRVHPLRDEFVIR